MLILRLIAFVRLFRFKMIYSKWNVNVLRVIVLGIFFWSVIGFVRDLVCSTADGFSLVHLIGLFASVFAIVKDIYGFVRQFHSSSELKRFKDRSDTKLLPFIQRLMSIDQDMTGFEVFKFKDHVGFVDFISYSKALNLQLSNGMEILSETTNSYVAWNEINQDLDESLKILALKQKANSFRRFTDDKKIAIVKTNINKANGMAEPVLHIKVAKTLYYASYLRNDFHRDFAYDGVDESNQMGDGVNWSPFVTVTGNGGKKVVLADFDYEKNSYHIGVNTLAVTLDGYVCLWKQKNGERSVGRVAPTGSGSMDWSDMKCMRDNVFNDAVIYGAERELREESFSKTVRKQLMNLSKAGLCLKSSIIGLYRWGSLGGLPGFILITLVPLKYSDITQAGKEAFGGGAECNLDTHNLDLNISPYIILNGQADKSKDNWRKSCSCTVARFRNGHMNELSVPLFACLKVLEETLETSDKLVDWLYGFLEQPQPV